MKSILNDKAGFPKWKAGFIILTKKSVAGNSQPNKILFWRKRAKDARGKDYR